MSAADIKTTTIDGKLTSTNGAIIIDDTSSHTNLVGVSFIAQEDTVIATCTGFDSAGVAIDFKTLKNWITPKAGALLIVPDNWYFKTIQLTSGSIIIYE